MDPYEELIHDLREGIDLLDQTIVLALCSRQRLAATILDIRGGSRVREREEEVLERVRALGLLNQTCGIRTEVDFVALYREHVLPEWGEM